MTEPPAESELRITPIAVLFFYGVLGAIAVGVAALLDIDPLEPMAVEAGSVWRDLGLGVAVGLAVVVLSRLLDKYFEWSRALNRKFKEVLGAIRPADTLVIAVASSVGEELLFRGLLLPLTGLWASSIIFGIVHGVSPGQPEHMWKTLKELMPLVLAATVMGFAFGGLVEYTGNILAAVVAHFTINYLNLNEMYRADWEAEAARGGRG